MKHFSHVAAPSEWESALPGPVGRGIGLRTFWRGIFFRTPKGPGRTDFPSDGQATSVAVS